jgi:hypothetical protein
LKQVKDALGWADFPMTRYAQIEKWWELVMCPFFMVSLFTDLTSPIPQLTSHLLNVFGGLTKLAGNLGSAIYG